MIMKSHWIVAVAITGLLLSGCATKKYVDEQLGSSEQRVAQRLDDVETQVESNQTAIRAQEERIDETQEALAQASGTAREAMERAQEAGKLAEGKFLYETTFTEDQVRFELNKADLGDEAVAALDEFADRIKADNQNVFIEIQGHTDSSGPEDYNETLGLERAEAVKRYLNRNHGFPLHRMSTISYGESTPVADNSSRESRAQNRRVVIVVLK